ncbi:hypothetical protein C4564_04770 [Candidatus Microgenomates bacterium]|nr:MAG: hypothetical protein C4564_04770 [Candidatus Microgenomates bacterium]
MKKIAASLLLFILIFSSNVAPTKAAQGDWWWPYQNDFIDKVENPDPKEIFGERYTHAQVSWIINSAVHILSGPVSKCGGVPDDQKLSCITTALSASNGGGPILALAGLNDILLTTKPASGVDYVATKLKKYDLVPEAYAQGYGFNQALKPIQTLWTAARNAAYALSTIALVVLAFMVMMRARISPQTVLSAQIAIPRIIIALIFITFSYAIAGFLVDLAFVVQGLIGAIMASSGLARDGATAVSYFNQMNQSAGGMLAFGIAFIVEIFFRILPIMTLLAVALAPTGVGTVGVVVADIIILLVLLLFVLVAMFKILFLFIKTYAAFIFKVAAWPFVILMNAVTGGSQMGYIKGLVAELSIFVNIGLIIMLAHFIFYGFGNATWVSGADWAGSNFLNLNPFQFVPMTGINDTGFFPSGFSFGDTATIGLFISFATLVGAPGFAKSIRDQIATGRAKFGFELGGAGVVGGVGKGTAAGAMSNKFEQMADARTGARGEKLLRSLAKTRFF